MKRRKKLRYTSGVVRKRDKANAKTRVEEYHERRIGSKPSKGWGSLELLEAKLRAI